MHKTSEAPPNIDLSGLHVLLVEDNEVIRDLTTELLEFEDMTVTTACDGQQAVDLLQRESFDGVLMDCQMPVMDGYTATRKIRHELGLMALPVIAMTGNTASTDRQRVLDAGMNDHLAKPINFDQLLDRLAKWLQPNTCKTGVQVEPIEVMGCRETTPEHGNESETDEYSSDLFLLRFKEIECDFVQRFRAALDRGNLEEATRHAHTLAGVAGSLGMPEVHCTARALEDACDELAGNEALMTLLTEVATALEDAFRNITGTRDR